MTIRTSFFAACLLATLIVAPLAAQQAQAPAAPKPSPKDTEVWEPEPKVVTPGATEGQAPSDAIVLFDGRHLDEWVNVKGGVPAGWTVADGVFTVNKPVGNIQTRRTFGSYQLHIEWRVPANITGKDQGRGNSGLFLASTGGGDAGYELQILDSYANRTYANGQAASIYKQAIPLANAMRKPGEWNVYDVIWTAPTFNADGTVKSRARITVLHNGVLVQNDYELTGETVYIGKPTYKAHGPSPIKLQAHGDPSEPLSFRNIWVRELK